MVEYICTICGYVHAGDSAPVSCPQCSGPESKFRIQEKALDALADEHRIGVAKGVDSSITNALRTEYNRECLATGRYLAMSRQADREGYPEVAEAYRRLALEEAEHAARYAELLGEVVTDKTEENLTQERKAEYEACSYKRDLATKAKQLNLDAIHDAVHEMAKDEGRHYRVFQGLLARYFEKK